MQIRFTFFICILQFSCFVFGNNQRNGPGYDLIRLSIETAYHNPDSAAQYAYQALLIARQTNDSFLEATAFIELGNAIRTGGDAPKSVRFFFKALDILDVRDSSNHSRIASAYSALGNAYYQLGDFNQATHYYRKGYEFKRGTGKMFETAVAATQLAGIYSVSGKPDSSFYYARFAFPYLQNKEHAHFLGNLYNAVGAAHHVSENVDSAIYYYKKSAAIFSDLNMLQQAQVSYYNIGTVLNDVNEYSSALPYLKKGMAICEVHPNINTSLLFCKEFTRAYEGLGNYSLALDYQKKSDSLSSAILLDKETAAFKEMEEKFKLAEQEKELQQQQFDLQQKDLDLAQSDKRFYMFLTFGILLLGILSFIASLFWFRRKTQEKIEQEKEKFFANVMHEIRTPLSLITGPAANLKNDLSEADRIKNFELISRNSKRLTTLVNQLLDVSKIDSGKFLLAAKSGNLSVFTREILENFEIAAMQKGITLNLEEEKTDGMIRADFDALEKIISNLLSNAIKYSSSKTTVTVSVKLDGNQLTIGVRDQGSGISKTEQQEIFSRFTRGKNQGMSSGVGIGLSLVKQLVDLMGGSIHLESKLNAGSYFEVQLPVEKSGVASDLRTLSEDAKVILLVEDDTDMREFVKSVLERENFNVVCAEHGKQALEILNDLLPDLILSDVMMPEMDGLSLTAEIRKNALFAHIPIVLLSARRSMDSKISGLEQGADLYLEKPFNPNELLLTVQNFLATLDKAREKFDTQLKKELSFEERIHSDDFYIQKLNTEILKELDNADFTVEDLSDRLAISRSQLHRKVKSLTGKSISTYVRIIRLEKAYDLLKNNAGNVTEIAYATGFNSQSYFTKSFVEYFGVAPKVYVRR